MMASGKDLRRQARGRNIALGVALAALVLLFYMITIAKLGGAP